MAVSPEEGFDFLQIIERKYRRVVQVIVGNPPGIRPDGGELPGISPARIDADQYLIVSPVIMSFKFGQFRPPGPSHRQPDGQQGRLQTRIGETDRVDPRIQFNERPGHVHFQPMGRSQNGRTHPVHLLQHRLLHPRVAVSQHQSPVAEIVVDIFVSVHILHAGAACRVHRDRIGIEIFDVGGHSSGQIVGYRSTSVRAISTSSRCGVPKTVVPIRFSCSRTAFFTRGSPCPSIKAP